MEIPVRKIWLAQNKRLVENAKEIVMKLRVLFCAVLVCPLALVAGQGQSKSAAAASASEIPHLRKQGTATQLIVDGKPFLALAGELHNNSATSLEYMKPIWAALFQTRRHRARWSDPDRVAASSALAGRRDRGSM